MHNFWITSCQFLLDLHKYFTLSLHFPPTPLKHCSITLKLLVYYFLTQSYAWIKSLLLISLSSNPSLQAAFSYHFISPSEAFQVPWNLSFDFWLNAAKSLLVLRILCCNAFIFSLLVHSGTKVYSEYLQIQFRWFRTFSGEHCISQLNYSSPLPFFAIYEI